MLRWLNNIGIGADLRRDRKRYEHRHEEQGRATRARADHAQSATRVACSRCDRSGLPLRSRADPTYPPLEETQSSVKTSAGVDVLGDVGVVDVVEGHQLEAGLDSRWNRLDAIEIRERLDHGLEAHVCRLLCNHVGHDTLA